MSDIAIKVENLGKRYRIGQSGNGYRTLRDTITDAVTAPFRQIMNLPGYIQKNLFPSTSTVSHPSTLTLTSTSSRPSTSTLTSASNSSLREEIWALKDVSFKVRRGEVVGIIGRNGAGKSTLLKILSRITEPSEGYAEIRGRVGSLLEVGTGFHAELSGRENIYLSGAILGMRKAEIERKFDEIVAFAEIEKFLDTPVKHYSSGMYVRLAFAVAAHLDPEILLVDEVLAVGDHEFQKKCLGKMGDVAKQGRTVLFVSHNMAVVQRLCGRSILLDKGNFVMAGESECVVEKYLSANREEKNIQFCTVNNGVQDEYPIKLYHVCVTDESGEIKSRFDIRKPIKIGISFRIQEDLRCVAPGIHIYSDDGICLFMSYDHNRAGWQKSTYTKGVYTAICKIPGNLLSEGSFYVTVAINEEAGQCVCLALRPHIIKFDIYDPFEGDSVRGANSNTWGGVIRPMLEWETQWVGSKVCSGGIQAKDMGKESHAGS